MAVEDDKMNGVFSQEDHQVAYIFNPVDSVAAARPSKRRRVSKKGTKGTKGTKGKELSGDGSSLADLGSSLFVPLLNGAEGAACVQERYRLYEESWTKVNNRIQADGAQRILRDSNSATLEQVSSFVREAKAECLDKIPTAFIVTGTNIASQDLLFEQLSETLQSGSSRFIGLRSTEAGSLKAVLKRIIRIAASKATEDDEDHEVEEKETNGQRYLDYDLEALHTYVQTHNCDQIFVAFQDSEGFDSSLLSDLIPLLSSWRPRIPFTLLFGVATSVELLQARLLKSACRQIYGGQFDDVQADTILESVFKGAVAASDVPLRLGAPLLRWMLDRQRDQVAGIQSFYAYLCHYFANPLSVLVGDGELIQAEHLEAIRNTPSFRKHVEAAIESGTQEKLHYARLLLEDDTTLRVRVQSSILERGAWMDERLRSLLMLEAAGAQHGSFSRAYVEAMGEGVAMSEHSSMVASLRRMGMHELGVAMERFISLLREGEPSLGLGPYCQEREAGSSSEGTQSQLETQLETQLAALRALARRADAEGVSVRSRYSGQSKVVRTTVVAQRVQLSHHSATLGDEDRRFTEIVDAVTTALAARGDETTPGGLFLSESWLYEARAPSRDVFVPRTRAVFERSLMRPYDYLACDCCAGDNDGEGLRATLPAPAILYQMYLETGNLINVADLWSSFYAVVSGRRGQPGEEPADDDGTEEDGADGDERRQREALVMFYRGLAELRALGYVKSSKKKTDHITKVKWL
ncbi:origin recognition complex subunit [Cordyceps fumosorosea ARSEF 2679]|uniref:Origin recognition complex subunit n=1 Tax=Cordyceps fumosorosea (strain ARSEF 2679) TaxID=1081104 RepID=A0A167XDN7_CORFA|nr:origin recognition complex subunit [Cordyceps fumosorosea ARSEF 2679]OAA64848.1 origin recognition complex subunit [Cordyceps fumosorosea ARSEF 2679]